MKKAFKHVHTQEHSGGDRRKDGKALRVLEGV